MAFNFNLPKNTQSYDNLSAFPITGRADVLYKAIDTTNLYTWNNSSYVLVDKRFASSWGQVSANQSSNSITKDEVGLGNVDNTADLDKPVSSATQTALNAKQELLVSGTNIKTINGSSVLGSGNLTISGGIVGVHSLLFIPSASVTNQMLTGTATLSGSLLTANTIIAAPFIPSQNITTSNLFMQVTTLFAGALCRIAIYSSVNSVPNNLLYVSSDLNMSSTGIKTAVTTFNFIAGTTYWLAIHGGTTGSSGVTAIQATNLIPIKASGIASSSFSVVTASSTFTSGTPSTFPTPTFASTNMPYIGITKA